HSDRRVLREAAGRAMSFRKPCLFESHVFSKPDAMRMDKPTHDTAKAPAKDPSKLTGVDIEAFAKNIARMVEEGGKALAAYMKPREEGKIKAELSEDVTDMVKTIGQVTEYWLSDPQRAL